MATKEKIYLAMELVRGGELFHRVSRGGKLREDMARRYFRQLISAVEFCHSCGVFHRDLKLENLLLGDDGNLKVADFGLSALASSSVRGDGLLHTTCGMPAYVAPEIVLKKGYDGAKVDIWSCGVILFTLLAGFLLFQADNIMLMYKKIVRGHLLGDRRSLPSTDGKFSRGKEIGGCSSRSTTTTSRKGCAGGGGDDGDGGGSIPTSAVRIRRRLSGGNESEGDNGARRRIEGKGGRRRW